MPAVLPSAYAALVAAALLMGACSTLCQGYLPYKLRLGAAVSALRSFELTQVKPQTLPQGGQPPYILQNHRIV